MSVLSMEARALLIIIASARHIDRKQYMRLVTDSPLAESVRELRSKGFLVPLSGVDEHGDKIPVYFLPSGMGRIARASALLLPPPDPKVKTRLLEELERVGYAVQPF
jgi:hypothetical protein